MLKSAGVLLASGSGTATAFGATFGSPYLVALDGSDYSVSGLTAKYRIRAGIAVNATAPAKTFTIGLYPITVAGAADTLTVTLGTVTSGSTVAVASPSASASATSAGSDFTPPSSGVYALGVQLSGAPAASSAGLVYARLEVRHV